MDPTKVLMAKLKVYLSAGEAKAAPPLGPLLGQYGINTVQFCKEFNEITEGFFSFFDPSLLLNKTGLNPAFELIVYIYIYDDRKYAFEICKPSTSFLLKLLAQVEKGDPHACKYMLSTQELIKIALFKYPTDKLYSSVLMIKGTARAIGIRII